MTVGFGLIAAAAASFAFVGLSSSGFWIDELYTLHLIDHDGGPGEVLRRSLTDTQPPAYYFVLWAWTRVTGVSEVSVRLLSALLAVLSLAVFGFGLRRIFRPASIAFATAVAATSMGWFEHAQNARNYALSLLVSSAMLTLAVEVRGRLKARGRAPPALFLSLFVVGLFGSFCHSYVLLGVGMVLGWLVLTHWRDLRVAAPLVASGVLILALNVVYLRLLAHSTQQDLRNLWFDNSPGFYLKALSSGGGRTIPETVVVAIAVLVVGGLADARRPPAKDTTASSPNRAWTAGLCAVTILGVTGVGALVSATIAPSISNRNLFTAAPFAWGLLAWLYDVAGPRGRTLRETLLALLLLTLVGANLALLAGRFLPLNQQWRASARYVQTVAGCAGRPIPVIYPFRFAPPDPAFRAVAASAFFGRYMRAGADLRVVLPAELAGRRRLGDLSALLAARSAGASPDGCPILAWGVHDLNEAEAVEVAEDLLRAPGVRSSRLLVQEFDAYTRAWLKWRPQSSAWVFLGSPPAPSGGAMAPPQLPPGATVSRGAGDLLAVDHLYSFSGRSGPPYTLDGYAVQRWRDGKLRSEVFSVVRRFTCDPPTSRSKAMVWPDLSLPGCSVRPLGSEYTPQP